MVARACAELVVMFKWLLSSSLRFMVSEPLQSLGVVD